MSAENKTISRRLAEEVISQGKTDLIDELVADDYVGYDIANPEPLRGREGVVEQMTTYRSAFSDLKITIHEQIAEGDRVVTRWRAAGTSMHALLGAPPLGGRIAVTGVTIHRIRDGRIVEGWTLWDAPADPAAAEVRQPVAAQSP